MGKVMLTPKPILGAQPVMLIGANIDGKPDFMVAGAGGVANPDPPMMTVAVKPDRYTFKGIKQNMTFSVNVPSEDMVKETDYCGIESGSRVDKVKACKFKIFYGKLNTAPLIEQCPINMACSVVQLLFLGSHFLVVGKVEETHINEDCLTDGKPDDDKIKPMIYRIAPERLYATFGKVIAKAYSVGLELKPGG